ncbi:MAG: flagellar hook basal-body protein [Acidobacteria bacterium]|jgi:flagellar basal body rod protein FlgG|nr:flagellar hook basal-body protein [Acidobacteriota bacterium]
MPGGIYAALSGMRTRMERLDRIAEDIANSGTAGYKGDRATTVVAERESFGDTLASAVDVMSAQPKVDFREGAVVATGRDLDLAIEGSGFFSIQTPAGVRYTRSGHFTRAADGTITTPDGDPLLGDGGPLRLPPGQLDFGADGTIRVGKTTVGRPSVTVFSDMSQLVRENGVRFRALDSLTPATAPDSRIRSGMLEQSNVLPTERMAQLIGTSRSFDALQRGIVVLMNDIDARAITELGRR